MTEQSPDDFSWEFSLGETGEDVELSMIFFQEMPEEWDESEIYL